MFGLGIGLFAGVVVCRAGGFVPMCEWRLALRRRGRAGLLAAVICVSGGWHIGACCCEGRREPSLTS